MKILGLKINDILGVTVVSIEPDGTLTVLGGDNGAGKSSVIKALWMALGGAKNIPDEPIRHGASQGSVELVLDDLVVSLVLKASKAPNLTVKTRDGKRFPGGPQKMLDSLVGRLSFDPLEFQRMKPPQQADVLRSLVPELDFEVMDADRKSFYDERTDVNRDAATEQARANGMASHEDAPDEEVSVVELMAELQKAQQHNQDIRNRQAEYERLQKDIQAIRGEREGIESDIQTLQDQVKSMLEGQAAREGQRETMEANLNKVKAIDTGEVEERITASEDTNRMVREKKARGELMQRVVELKTQSSQLTDEIKDIDEAKVKALKEAKLPVDGLNLTEAGVTFGGLPFEQASDAEQLRVSMAMALAMNPELKLCCIRDGSLLDSKSLELVRQMAEAADAQVIMERVGVDEHTTVVLEDGTVKGATPVKKKGKVQKRKAKEVADE